MTRTSLSRAFLKQVSPVKAGQQAPLVFFLTNDRQVVIGRDPRCQIVLDAQLYVSVSRRHVEVKPSLTQTGDLGWQICDLSSANGTFVNGEQLQGCRVLQGGDRIALSKNGPEFSFEYESTTQLDSGLNNSQIITGLTLTQLIPIFSTGRDLLHKAYLIPVILTIVCVVLMFASLGQPVIFNFVLSIYIIGTAYYFIYQLCSKPKPWWILLACTLSTIFILCSPVLNIFIFIFRQLLPGSLPNGQVNFLHVFVSMFFGAGLMEELLKALPVLVLWQIGLNLKAPWRDRIGVWEPLDGILLGTASAVGFTLLETLGLYVPSIVQSVALQAGSTAVGELTGLQLLIPRVLGSVAGHMAYSGYLGYFIGLAVLKPSKRWQILIVGYFSAASLHALWNTSATVSSWLLVVIGGLSYAFLAAAILKARTLSPKPKSPPFAKNSNDETLNKHK